MMNSRRLRMISLPFVLALAACGSNTREYVGLTMQIGAGSDEVPPGAPQQMSTMLRPDLSFLTAPSTIGGFNCLLVNVVGNGIAPVNLSQYSGNQTPDVGPMLAGDHCTYPGVLSPLVSATASSFVSMQVPSGAARLIQIAGVVSTVGCPSSQGFKDVALGYGSGFDDAFPGFFEVGRKVVDLFSNSTVSIDNSYSSSSPKRIDHCEGGGQEIDLAPDEVDGLALWLDASQITGVSDNATFDTWADMSGNGYDAVQTTSGKQPSFKLASMSGKPAVEFGIVSTSTIYLDLNSTFVNTYFDLDSAMTVSHSVVIVERPNIYDAGRTLIGTAINSTYRGYRLDVDGASYRIQSTGNNPSTVSGGAIFGTVGSIPPTLLVSTHSPSASLAETKLYKNGGSVIDQSIAISNQSGTTSGTLGNDPGATTANGSATNWVGLISEVIVYDHVLSTGEREGVECYLGEKYNISIAHSCTE